MAKDTRWICATPRYSIILDTTPYQSRRGEQRMTVEAIAHDDTTNARSVVCTMNRLVGNLPEWVTVYQMSNNWNIPADRLPDLIKWFCSWDIDELERYLNENQQAGEWVIPVDDQHVDEVSIMRGE